MFGNGGRLSCGTDGMVLGSGGKVVGSVGTEGKGGSVGLGKFGVVVCIRWRAPRLMLMLEKIIAKRKAVMNDLLEAIAEYKV
uniref:Uncharacterized protein n=1 Tax=Cajanus cajan TaxID=3821 RepID=A0A151T7T9_CAJCA|nr:hypothetical protein KK1_017617 [Cajanus cajan]KYP63074.1 hypothetical protein KK1_017638 [Cajanus cajan]